MADLTYYIFDGILVGFAGGGHIFMIAGSGGGSGSTSHTGSDTANNVYATGVKTTGGSKSKSHKHGGPLPLGKYKIHPSAKNPHLGRSCYLEPDPHNQMFGRSGFYIHGTGPHGSDGCIVPPSRLSFLLDQIDKDGGGTMFVEETTGGERFA
jgi:hypothetical protein